MVDVANDEQQLVIKNLNELRESLLTLAQGKTIIRPYRWLRKYRLDVLKKPDFSLEEKVAVLRSVLDEEVFLKTNCCRFCDMENSLSHYLVDNGMNPEKYKVHILTACLPPGDKPIRRKKALPGSDKRVHSYLSNQGTTNPDLKSNTSHYKFNPVTSFILAPALTIKINNLIYHLRQTNSNGSPLSFNGKTGVTKMAGGNSCVLLKQSTSTLSQFSPSVIKQKVVVKFNDDENENRSILKNKIKKRKLF